MKQRIINQDPDTYHRHLIHTRERDWAETNCYVDVWIELLHALGYEPLAAMPFTLAIDFEGDQWTFFKMPLQDLYALYGIEVQELAVWKTILGHAEQQLNLGRPFLVELDSKYLPDTQGTAYQLQHVKTTVAITGLDSQAQTMEYFHGQGFYRLQGQDFVDVFRLDNLADKSYLAPYVEIAKLHRPAPLPATQLKERSVAILMRVLDEIPRDNPFDRFKKQLIVDLEWLTEQDMETFHAYSFATLRQFGACYELAALYLSWLEQHGESNLTTAIRHFRNLSEQAKVCQFQLARTVSRKKNLDTSMIDNMAREWAQGMQQLKQCYHQTN